jgi:tRNA (guanine-N7-)-methyltransferase
LQLPLSPKNLKYPFRWKDRRPYFADKVLYVPDYYPNHGEWRFPGWEALFGNAGPVNVEYCSGNGLWIVNKAREFPEKNWVAVEWQFERARKIWSKMKNDNLSNLLIVAGEALTFTQEYIPGGELDEVYVNFPDPWPKERHAKNRLFQEVFIDQLARVLKPQGTLTIATDDVTYSAQIGEKMCQSLFFSARFKAPHYITEWPGYGDSYFDNLWRSQGKTIHYFQFERL